MIAVLGVIAIAVVLVLYVTLRDRSLRGIRVTNCEVRREQITPSLPNSWMADFWERRV